MTEVAAALRPMPRTRISRPATAAQAGAAPAAVPAQGTPTPGALAVPAPAPVARKEPEVPETVTGVGHGPGGEATTLTLVRGRMLGKGGFAHVYEMKEAGTGKAVAVKVTPLANLIKPRQKKKLAAEIAIHQSLSHKNIVKFEEYFQDTQNAYIVMELCSQGTLLDMLRKRRALTEAEARYWLLQVVGAVKYMHESLVIHRDLKLANCFIHNMEIKIGDFGLAAKLENASERKKTLCGTPNYIAPEVLDDKTGHSFEVDVWSIGVMMYTLIIGRPPFETAEVQETYKRIKEAVYTFPADKPISDQAQSLIRSVFVRPERRPTLDDMLRHPFFTEHSVPRSLPSHALSAQPALPATPPRPNLHSGNCAIPPPGAKETDPFDNPNNFVHKLPVVVRPLRARSVAQQAGVAQPMAKPLGLKDVAANLQKMDIGAVVAEVSPTQIEERRLRNILVLLDEVITLKRIPQVLAGHWQRPQAGVWVRSWLDYSEKYGLAYNLTSGAYGVVFNDKSRILLRPRQTVADYYASSNSTVIHLPLTKTKDEVGHDIDKKLQLVKFFQDSLCASEKENKSQQMPVASSLSAADEAVYMRSYMRTSRAILMRMSNGAMQVNFTDHSSTMVMVALPALVAFAPKPDAGQSSTTVHADMIDNLRYFKTLVERLLGRFGK